MLLPPMYLSLQSSTINSYIALAVDEKALKPSNFPRIFFYLWNQIQTTIDSDSSIKPATWASGSTLTCTGDSLCAQGKVFAQKLWGKNEKTLSHFQRHFHRQVDYTPMLHYNFPSCFTLTVCQENFSCAIPQRMYTAWRQFYYMDQYWQE